MNTALDQANAEIKRLKAMNKELGALLGKYLATCAIIKEAVNCVNPDHAAFESIRKLFDGEQITKPN